jgi:hypothetical protein
VVSICSAFREHSASGISWTDILMNWCISIVRESL